MATNESSVLMNLKELFTIEADRRADEAVASERAKAEAAARVEAERRAREQEIEAARVEERRRAEQERAQRDAKVEERLRALRDELEEVRAQREEVRARVAELASRPAGPARRGSWGVALLAAASLLAAVTATAVAWPRNEPRVARLDAPDAPREVSPDVEPEVTAPTPSEAEPTGLQERPADPPAVVASAEPERQQQRSGSRPRQPRERERTLTDQLDLGEGDEVLSDEFLRRVGP